MAQKVEIRLIDDLDGKKAVETIAFGLDGKSYEIDLSAGNAKKLRDALAPYIQAGRKGAKGTHAPKSQRARSNGNGAGNGPSAAEIRAWAQANGHEVTDRGRIPAELRDAYLAAR